MKDEDLKHLTDLETALDALGPELEAGPLTDAHAFAAVRARLILIADLVQTLPTALIEQEPVLPWRDLAALRDLVGDSYTVPDPTLTAAPIHYYRPLLTAAVRRLAASLSVPEVRPQ